MGGVFIHYQFGCVNFQAKGNLLTYCVCVNFLAQMNTHVKRPRVQCKKTI